MSPSEPEVVTPNPTDPPVSSQPSKSPTNKPTLEVCICLFSHSQLVTFKTYINIFSSSNSQRMDPLMPLRQVQAYPRRRILRMSLLNRLRRIRQMNLQ